jgi:hypothetical protein
MSYRELVYSDKYNGGFSFKINTTCSLPRYISVLYAQKVMVTPGLCAVPRRHGDMQCIVSINKRPSVPGMGICSAVSRKQNVFRVPGMGLCSAVSRKQNVF